MTRLEFQTLLRNWCIEDADESLGIEELKRDVEFLERELYHEYTVTEHGDHGSFGYRLARWISCLDNPDDQKTLYGILRHLFFIGTSEQKAAYRTAYSKHILQWIMHVHAIDPFSVDARQEVIDQLAKTRFTEVTDSFGIRSFCLLNGIQGEDTRYKWEGNTSDWDAVTFRRDVMKQNQPYETEKTNLVLLEDFVGSGSQMEEAVQLAISLGPDVEILLCPLFICPDGADLARNLAYANEHLTFSPILEFERRFFITPDEKTGEHKDFQKIRDLLIKIHPKIEGIQQEYGPFGYRRTGGLIVPASNCPDNTIPAIHREKQNSWEPLFLRTSRLPI